MNTKESFSVGSLGLSPPPGFTPPGFSMSVHHQPAPQQQLQHILHLPELQRVEKTKRAKDRRVSWPNGEKLCQVRLFIAEDAPSMAGAIQDQLQAKQTRNLHVFNTKFSTPPDAPPGFGGVAFRPKPDYVLLASIVPQISWRTPRVINLDPTWEVVAGSASREVDLQKQREVRMLEAVYPRPSSIPESPAEPVEAQEAYDDSSTPQIPLVPPEEEDIPEALDDSSRPLDAEAHFPSHVSSGQGAQSISPKPSDMSDGILDQMRQQYIGNGGPVQMQEIAEAWRSVNGVSSSQARFVESDPTGGRVRPMPTIQLAEIPSINAKLPGVVEPDISAAAAVVFAALKNSQEMDNMIDNDLLVQILKDPSLLEGLKQPSPNSATNMKKLDLHTSTSTASNSVSQRPVPLALDKFKKMQALNILNSGSGSNQWSGPPSTSFMPSPLSSGGPEGGSDGMRKGDPTYNSGNRPLRTASADDRSSSALLIGGVGRNGDGQQLVYNPDPFMAGGRLGPSVAPPRPLNAINNDAPPGFGGDVGSGKSNNLLGGVFNNKSLFQHGPAAPLGPTTVGSATGSMSGRPVGQFAEQYYKNLILQHGCKSADDDDHGRLVMDKTKSGNGVNITSKSSNAYSSIVNPGATTRWYGRENLDGPGPRPERSGRDRREPADRSTVTDPETPAPRPKSRKLCIYYGTARGCRNGDNCAFVHEKSELEKPRTDRVKSSNGGAGTPTTTLPYSKRLKVDG